MSPIHRPIPGIPMGTLSRIGYRLMLLAPLLVTACENQTRLPSEPLARVQNDTALEHAVKHLNPRYVCPMHPQIVQDAPGNCPICGMTLVLKPLAPEADPYPPVTLDGAVIQTMGARTTRVERGTLWKYIRAVGRVDYDETRLAHLHPRASGWVERLGVRAEGAEVSQGQVLGYLYAPDILSAQVEFLVALRQYGKTDAQKLDKARNLLRLLGVPENIIKEIEQRGEPRNTVPLLSPINGVVTRLGMRDGMYVEPGGELVTLADLSQVWVLVDVFEQQIGWLKPGLRAEIRTPAHPEQVWKGEVDYLYPELDPKSRTLRVRLRFPNPNTLLRPNMFTDAVIYGGPKANVLRIPRDALIATGEREVVVKALGGGRFQPVRVATGLQRDGQVEILSGLQEGDEILISGQFLIDSESSLQASFRRLSQVPAAQPSHAPE